MSGYGPAHSGFSYVSLNSYFLKASPRIRSVGYFICEIFGKTVHPNLKNFVCSDVVDRIRLFQLRILVVRLEGHYLHDTFNWTESNNHVKGLFHKCSDSIWMGLKSNWPTACTWLKKRRPEVQPETIPPQMTTAALNRAHTCHVSLPTTFCYPRLRCTKPSYCGLHV